MKSGATSLSLALVAVLALSSVANAQPEPSPTAPVMSRTSPAMYNLPSCSTPEQLDCVSSIEVKPPSGEFVAVTTDRPQVWTLGYDNLGNEQHQGSSYWFLPPSGTAGYFAVSAQLYTPANTRVSGLLSVSVDDLPAGYLARVSVRTSWLRPQNLQFKAASASYSHSVIAGGNLWTFTGSNSKMSNYNSEEGFASGWTKKADVDYTSLLFTIHHAGVAPEKSWFSTRCADVGFSAQAFNAPGAGSPEWDRTTQSLRFNIGAPHLDSQGNKNIGFFRLWVSEAFASCQWPENNLVGAASLVGTIYNEDGSIQDADITVTNENGMIYLDAKNFHYSAPIFQITASGTAIKPGSTISSPKPSSSATPTSKPSPSASSSESSESSANPEELRTLETTAVTATSEETNSGAYIAIGFFLALLAATVAYTWIRKRQGKPFVPDTLKESVSKFTKRKHKNF
jgi:hypothetical protein